METHSTRFFPSYMGTIRRRTQLLGQWSDRPKKLTCNISRFISFSDFHFQSSLLYKAIRHENIANPFNRQLYPTSKVGLLQLVPIRNGNTFRFHNKDTHPSTFGIKAVSLSKQCLKQLKTIMGSITFQNLMLIVNLNILWMLSNLDNSISPVLSVLELCTDLIIKLLFRDILAHSKYLFWSIWWGIILTCQY